jgi:hypothetical protein
MLHFVKSAMLSNRAGAAPIHWLVVALAWISILSVLVLIGLAFYYYGDLPA